jgi:Secretion system C-terminal sorting domain
MKFKLLLFCFALNYSLSAGDFRGGDIHVEQHTALSVQVNININLVIHSEIDQITICWGDGSCDILGTTQVLEYPSIDTKTLRFFWIHNYNQYGFYDLTVEECCWADDIVNMNLINEQDFVLLASFKLLDPQIESFNVMPFSPALPVSIGNFQEYLVYNSFVNIPESDESTFEICAVDVVNYYLLDEIFTQPNNFIFDPLTGGFLWFSPPSPGFFIVKVCITTTRGGQLISQTSRDILIAIQNIVDIKNIGDSDDFDLKYYPNPTQDFIHFEYILNEKSTVEIELFDVMGKKIKPLLLETKNSGAHEELFDLHELPQGFYFCKIKIEDTFYTIPFIKE